jgi:hypothetical protein
MPNPWSEEEEEDYACHPTLILVLFKSRLRTVAN